MLYIKYVWNLFLLWFFCRHTVLPYNYWLLLWKNFHNILIMIFLSSYHITSLLECSLNSIIWVFFFASNIYFHTVIPYYRIPIIFCGIYIAEIFSIFSHVLPYICSVIILITIFIPYSRHTIWPYDPNVSHNNKIENNFIYLEFMTNTYFASISICTLIALFLMF